MTRLLFILLYLIHSMAICQSDSIVSRSLTRELVLINTQGVIAPAFDLSKLQTAHLLITEKPAGQVEICNATPVSIWVNGGLMQKIEAGCDFIDFDFFNFDQDTLWLSFNSAGGLGGLQIHEILPGSQEVPDRSIRKRATRNPFNEFAAIGVIFLLVFAGIITVRQPNQVNNLLSRTFSLKNYTYDQTNIQFVSEAGLSFALFLSALIGYSWIFVSHQSTISAAVQPTSFGIQWLRISSIVFAFIVLKWILSWLFSSLFGFNRNIEIQIQDFVNIGIILSIFIFLVLITGFTLDLSIQKLYTAEWKVGLFLLIGASQIFFWLKFVNNIAHKKLLIISYLCATEIMPFTLLTGWFFK